MESSEQPLIDLDRRVVDTEPECPELIRRWRGNLIDGSDQIIIVDLPPLVTRKRAASC